MSETNWTNEYRTGQMRPRKNCSTLLSLLLMAVIFLGGIVSAFGLLNIRPFRQAQDTPKEDASLSFYQNNDQKASDSVEPSLAQESPDVTLPITPSPSSVENTPQEGGLSLQQIYASTIDSVVSISCTLPGGNTSGTGVIIAKEGYLVTNAHVVADATRIRVQLSDGRTFDATCIGSDTVSDLAVLYVPAANLTAAVFGDSDALRVGDLAVAIGDPLGADLRGTMTDGIISAINRNIQTDGRTMTLIQTNAALNSGNSGGPLLNCYGQVIGINTMKIGDYVSDAGVEGLGFAIPSTTVKTVVDDLLQYGYVKGRPTLGLTFQELSALYQRMYNLPSGLYITQVNESSDAAQKGISPGDVLTSFDGTEVSTLEALNSLLYNHQAGDTVEVVIYRGGKLYRLELTIDQAGKK
ncbi:MAG: trypsin-like peptidase domain-containing protein [Oscillospiraceae bacterium]|nr:trypsin-like peptidase domain-containing protein [Oscillospiraceae bacterium]